ncbi:hypothetical protein [Amycolatopsis sp. 195334CR]|uniref:hypothetical protein n=1 Tax=Amycolatopsis sp. 195334CR TaxID=2814588 RepID=UPI001A8E5D00|nr:hypothetical protein [Amycolatopsis sp. 195334CR]MBN6037474.1 hypothetical protein [Amycolatopsis sp. 195334CR]
MSAIRAAADELTTALSTVDGVRLHELGEAIDPPGLVLGAPRLAWQAYSTGLPTSATFPVFLVVGFSDRALTELWDLIPVVAEVIENETDGTISGANPGTYVGSNTELPCYTFDVDFPLTQERP